MLAKATLCAHGKASAAGVISVRRSQGCLFWTELQQTNHREWLSPSAKLVVSVKTYLRMGRKHPREREERTTAGTSKRCSMAEQALLEGTTAYGCI